MNEGEKLAGKIQWNSSLDQELFMASFFDDGITHESELLQFLSHQESMQAAKRLVADERRHYIVRRWFQRLFVASVLKIKDRPDKLKLIHALDTRPHCLDAPQLQLSFSTSGAMMVACGSFNGAVGIDIERKRHINNAAQLATRFFSAIEANALATMPQAEQSANFLLHWTAKEAGLKAVGQGIVSDLNRFQLTRLSREKPYEIQELSYSPDCWTLNFMDFLPEYVTALVQKNDVD